MIGPAHLRMAKAIFGMTDAEVGAAVNVNGQTISAFILKKRAMSSTTLAAIEAYFKGRGVVFLEDGVPSLTGGVGIRMRDEAT